MHTHLCVVTTQGGELWLAAGSGAGGPETDYALSDLGAPADIPITRLRLDPSRRTDHDVAGVLVEHDRATPAALAIWTGADTPALPPDVVRVRTCRICGCTDDGCCWPGCWWVEADLCSACADVAGVQSRTIAGVEARDLLVDAGAGGAS